MLNPASMMHAGDKNAWLFSAILVDQKIPDRLTPKMTIMDIDGREARWSNASAKTESFASICDGRQQMPVIGITSEEITIVLHRNARLQRLFSLTYDISKLILSQRQ